jgi:DNA-binding NarL/FixJ family response regulator
MKKLESEKILRVLVVSNDKFARNWITQLLMRDWRTQVTEEIDRLDDLLGDLDSTRSKFLDVAVIDTDNIDFELSDLLESLEKIELKFLLLSKVPDEELFSLINLPHFRGYLTKEKSDISLPWALHFAYQGFLVFSDDITSFNSFPTYVNRRKYLILSDIEALDYLTPSENRIAQLALVFSMSRGNLADELMLSPGSSTTMVSNLYNALGVNDLLKGNDWIRFKLDENPLISSHLEQKGENSYTTNKNSNKETLAYHVYTKPKVQKPI